MFAFITNLNLTEITVIVVGAVIIFGKDLPQVVMRGVQQLGKLRRGVKDMWTEAGLEQEMRKVRADLESEIPDITSPRQLIQKGKDFVEKPVEAWRKNIQREIEDVVPVQKKRPEPPGPDAAPDTQSVDLPQIAKPEPAPKPNPKISNDPFGWGHGVDPKPKDGGPGPS